jgi:hypothetical protein
MSIFESLSISEILNRLLERGVSSPILNVIESVEKNFSIEALQPRKPPKKGKPVPSTPPSISKVWDTLMSFVRSGDLTTIPRKDTQACKSLMYMLSFQSSPLEDRIGKLLSYMFITCVDDSRVAIVHTDEDPVSLSKWITLLSPAIQPPVHVLTATNLYLKLHFCDFTVKNVSLLKDFAK